MSANEIGNSRSAYLAELCPYIVHSSLGQLQRPRRGAYHYRKVLHWQVDETQTKNTGNRPGKREHLADLFVQNYKVTPECAV